MTEETVSSRGAGRQAPENAQPPETAMSAAMAQIAVQSTLLFFREIPSDFRLQHPEPELYTTADPKERAAVQREMNAFLARTVTPEEMFPDSSSNLVLAFPRRYSRVRADDINRMFPNADIDARALLDRYVRVFQRNFLIRLAFRRFAQFISTIAMFCTGLALVPVVAPWSIQAPPAQWLLTVLAYMAAYLVGWLAVYTPIGWFIAGLASPPREHSAQALSQNMLERFQALGNCINAIALAERDYFHEQESVWVVESNYLVSLLVWLPMRVYHLENYFQIKMGVIRTSMWFGQFFALLIAVMVWGVVWIGVAQAPAEWFVGGDAGRVVFICLAGVWVLHSSLTGATRLDAIRRLITIDKWQTLGRIHMHSQLAKVVGFLINKFIMLRDAGRDKKG